MEQPPQSVTDCVWPETKSSLPHAANIGKSNSVQKSLNSWSSSSFFSSSLLVNSLLKLLLVKYTECGLWTWSTLYLQTLC